MPESHIARNRLVMMRARYDLIIACEFRIAFNEWNKFEQGTKEKTENRQPHENSMQQLNKLQREASMNFECNQWSLLNECNQIERFNICSSFPSRSLTTTSFPILFASMEFAQWLLTFWCNSTQSQLFIAFYFKYLHCKSISCHDSCDDFCCSVISAWLKCTWKGN